MQKKDQEFYCLFKKQTPFGKVWYVKFWDNALSRYTSFKSTGISVEGKREHRRDAEDAAKKLYISFNERKVRSEIINKPFIQFLLDFWTPESEYVREKRLVDKKPLSMHYIKNSNNNIRLV